MFYLIFKLANYLEKILFCFPEMSSTSNPQLFGSFNVDSMLEEL